MKAITTKSGKVIEPQSGKEKVPQTSKQPDKKDQQGSEKVPERSESRAGKKQGKSTNPSSVENLNLNILPYTDRARKDKIDNQFAKFMAMFNKLQVNIPFAKHYSRCKNTQNL